MKATHLASVLAVSVVVLAGCASQNKMARATVPHDIDDQAYIAQVEQTARTRGVEVRWINPPQKRVPDASAKGL
ncbi:MAG: hypothetical protein HOQ02_09260 [Lysobacter sp.]|nr:hypothetical protein [Lysobacter sp.]